jgi:hypothetical protein
MSPILVQITRKKKSIEQKSGEAEDKSEHENENPHLGRIPSKLRGE